MSNFIDYLDEAAMSGWHEGPFLTVTDQGSTKVTGELSPRRTLGLWKRSGSGWEIYHLASGSGVLYSLTHPLARRIAMWMEEYSGIDWSLKDPTGTYDPELFEAQVTSLYEGEDHPTFESYSRRPRRRPTADDNVVTHTAEDGEIIHEQTQRKSGCVLYVQTHGIKIALAKGPGVGEERFERSPSRAYRLYPVQDEGKKQYVLESLGQGESAPRRHGQPLQTITQARGELGHLILKELYPREAKRNAQMFPKGACALKLSWQELKEEPNHFHSQLHGLSEEHVFLHVMEDKTQPRSPMRWRWIIQSGARTDRIEGRASSRISAKSEALRRHVQAQMEMGAFTPAWPAIPQLTRSRTSKKKVA